MKTEFAFPQEFGNSQAMNGSVLGPGKTTGGLTKREYFAGLAMQGFLANTNVWEEWNMEKAIFESLRHADALLAELEKPND